MKSRGIDSIYSWMVAVACGIVFLLVGTPMRLGSLIFVSLKDSYGTTRDAASFPFQLAYIARSLSGPFAGYFGQAIGLGRVTLIGSLLGVAGLMGCFFANSIVTIDICLGLIFGFGFGWSTAVAPEIVNQHFLKHRTKAIGLIFGVSGLAASLTPPLLEYILNIYGESASFLIISGIMLNTIPASMLIRKPNEQTGTTSEEVNSVNCEMQKEMKPDAGSNPQLNGNSEKSKWKNFFTVRDIYSIETSNTKKKFSNDADDYIIYNSRFTPIKEPNSDYNSLYTKNNSKLKLTTLKTQQVSENKMVELNVNTLSNQFTQLKSKSRFKSIARTNSVLKVENKSSKFKSFNILWSTKFLLITFTQSSHFYIMYIFWTITIDVVRDKGVEKSSEVYFVMALSFFDTIGRFFLASVTDCTRITAVHFSSVCFVIMGLACLLLVFVSGFEGTMVAISLLGLIVGGNTTSLPGIVTSFIEKDKRPLAMASRLIMYAPMGFTMSPLIGYFREELYSYDGLLYILMSLSFVCSIGLQILSQLHKSNGNKT